MSSEVLDQFIAKNNFGLLMRTFATKPDDISERVEMVGQALHRVNGLQINGQSIFKRTDVYVWKDERYSSSDCGETAAALKSAYPQLPVSQVNGDLFCSLMNTGFASQLRHGVDYTLTLSPEAYSYATPETLSDMILAASRGALAIGVAFDELTESILAGRLANTFAMYQNLSLMGVGGFDLQAAFPPRDPRLASYLRGWSTENGGSEVFYPKAGVEEMIPLARLFDRIRRPFIAPILPRGEGMKAYQRSTTPELLARHKTKMDTKHTRQDWMLMSAGYDPSWLKGAVMDEYRHSDS